MQSPAPSSMFFYFSTWFFLTTQSLRKIWQCTFLRTKDMLKVKLFICCNFTCVYVQYLISRCDGAVVMVRHHKQSWKCFRCVNKMTCCRLSWHLVKNTQWFHTYICRITVSNSGFWLHYPVVCYFQMLKRHIEYWFLVKNRYFMLADIEKLSWTVVSQWLRTIKMLVKMVAVSLKNTKWLYN